LTSYDSEYARLYDVFYETKPYGDEAAFIAGRLKEHGAAPPRRLLELACGTGRHALELQRSGYDITATDYSSSVLEVARARAADAGAPIDFQRQDMRALDLGGRRFGAAICLFDALGYVQTNEAVVDTLRGLHRALEPSGVFVFEVWHAAAMLRSFEPLRVREFQDGDRRIIRVSTTELLVDQQLARVKYDIVVLDAGGTARTFSETHVGRYFSLQEIRYFLESCDFELLEAFDGFSENRSITSATWHIVAVARKTGGRSEG
jgi:SAM-dependent methyltransferase